MTTGTNTTLKGSIIFGAVIIAAAVAFAGSQDGASEAPEAAEGAPEQKVEFAPGSQAERRAQDAEQIEEYGEEELLEWGEDALLDDTAGFDPTPGGEVGSNDDAIADVYVEVQDGPPAQLRPRVSEGPPAPGVPVGIPSNSEMPGH